jgi:hypothetical protein
MLLRYQYPVNCRIRNEEGNFWHKVHYRYCCHFQAWKWQLKDVDGLPSQGKKNVEFLQIILEPVTSSVVISEVEALYVYVEALMYVVLSKTKKHVPYRELVGTWMCDVTAEVLHKPMSL